MKDGLEELRRENEERIKASIQRILEVLKGRAERISVFGSVARGEEGLFSDLDVLIVMKTEKPYIERLKELYRELCLSADCDLVCYTPEEFERLKETPFLKKVLSEEVVLYEKGRG